MNIGGFSDAVFNVSSAFLADNNQQFVAEVEAIELQSGIGILPVLRRLEAYAKTINTRGRISGSRVFVFEFQRRRTYISLSRTN